MTTLFGAALADAVLHAADLARMPAVEKVAQDAAVAAELAIIVRRAFPDAQGGEMRRLERADRPLVHRVVGNAVDADLAVAPGLRAGPFDALIEVLGLARRPHVEHARRAAGAARVDAQADIAVRHPFLRIDQLPVLILVARAFEHFRRRFGEPRPVALVAFLERKALGIGAVAQDHRIFAVAERAKHVGAQHHAVVHCDRRVPIDLHAVANFGFHFSMASVIPPISFAVLPLAVRAAMTYQGRAMRAEPSGSVSSLIDKLRCANERELISRPRVLNAARLSLAISVWGFSSAFGPMQQRECCHDYVENLLSKTASLTTKHLDVRLRKIRSLKTSALKPLKIVSAAKILDPSRR